MKPVLWLLVSAFFVFWFVRWLEQRAIFFPMRELALTPSEVGMAYDEVRLTTADGVVLNGWWMDRPGASRTLLFFHGNAGNISHRLDKAAIFRDLGLRVLMVDYRGYGKSEGRPREKGLYRDARAAYDYLVRERDISPSEVVLYGESLGGAVAIELALGLREGALVTEGAFSSIADMARIAFPLVPSFLLSTRFASDEKIGKVAVPKLVIHSVDDEIIPFRLGEKLYAKAEDPKTFLKIRGSHNNAFLDSRKTYEEGLRAFLRSLPEPRTA